MAVTSLWSGHRTLQWLVRTKHCRSQQYEPSAVTIACPPVGQATHHYFGANRRRRMSVLARQLK